MSKFHDNQVDLENIKNESNDDDPIAIFGPLQSLPKVPGADAWENYLDSVERERNENLVFHTFYVQRQHVHVRSSQGKQKHVKRQTCEHCCAPFFRYLNSSVIT